MSLNFQPIQNNNSGGSLKFTPVQTPQQSADPGFWQNFLDAIPGATASVAQSIAKTVVDPLSALGSGILQTGYGKTSFGKKQFGQNVPSLFGGTPVTPYGSPQLAKGDVKGAIESFGAGSLNAAMWLIPGFEEAKGEATVAEGAVKTGAEATGEATAKKGILQTVKTAATSNTTKMFAGLSGTSAYLESLSKGNDNGQSLFNGLASAATAPVAMSVLALGGMVSGGLVNYLAKSQTLPVIRDLAATFLDKFVTPISEKLSKNTDILETIAQDTKDSYEKYTGALVRGIGDKVSGETMPDLQYAPQARNAGWKSVQGNMNAVLDKFSGLFDAGLKLTPSDSTKGVVNDLFDGLQTEIKARVGAGIEAGASLEDKLAAWGKDNFPNASADVLKKMYAAGSVTDDMLKTVEEKYSSALSKFATDFKQKFVDPINAGHTLDAKAVQVFLATGADSEDSIANSKVQSTISGIRGEFRSMFENTKAGLGDQFDQAYSEYNQMKNDQVSKFNKLFISMGSDVNQQIENAIRKSSGFFSTKGGVADLKESVGGEQSKIWQDTIQRFKNELVQMIKGGDTATADAFLKKSTALGILPSLDNRTLQEYSQIAQNNFEDWLRDTGVSIGKNKDLVEQGLGISQKQIVEAQAKKEAAETSAKLAVAAKKGSISGFNTIISTIKNMTDPAEWQKATEAATPEETQKVREGTGASILKSLFGKASNFFKTAGDVTSGFDYEKVFGDFNKLGGETVESKNQFIKDFFPKIAPQMKELFSAISALSEEGEGKSGVQRLAHAMGAVVLGISGHTGFAMGQIGRAVGDTGTQQTLEDIATQLMEKGRIKPGFWTGWFDKIMKSGLTKSAVEEGVTNPNNNQQ